MKRLSFTLIFLILGFGLYAQEPVNILQKINVSGDSGNVIIGFDFNGPVSFTSMKLTDPYRIVLDFTDCKKGGSIKNSTKIDSDGIKEIQVSQMGSNDAPTLRITIITTVDLDFNIEPTDNGINVRIAGVKLASNETNQKASEEPANVVEVSPKQQEEVKPAEPTSVVAEAKPEPKPEPAPVVAESKPEPKPEPAPVVAEAKPEPKPEPAPVVTEAKPEPKPEPAPVVAEAKPEPKPEPAPVVAEAKPEPKPEPAPVVAEAKPEPKPEPAPVVAEAKPEPKPEPAPVVTEAKPEAKAEPKKEEKKPKFKPAPAMAASNEESGQETKKPKFKPAPAMAASNEDKSTVDHFTPPPRKKSSTGRNSLTWIGFQMSANGSRIFIKTIDEAEYSIKEKDDKTLILEIYNTDIPKKNNRRPLDTSFFNTPVAYISPQIESGSIKVVRIEIKLKQRVPFITKQESNALYVDFEGVN